MLSQGRAEMSEIFFYIHRSLFKVSDSKQVEQ